MSKKVIEVSSEVKALVNAFKEHKGEKMTFAKACEYARVENKTGYLTGVKRQLGSNLAIGEKDMEVQVSVKKKVNSYTYTPTDTD